MRLAIACSALCLVLPASSPRADDAADRARVQAALDRPLLNAGETLAEVQDYADPRIARMPAVKSADEWTKMAESLRQRAFDEVLFRGEAHNWLGFKGKVEWLDTIPGGPGYHIRKLRYEVVPGLWVPGLLYEPEHLPDGAKVPVVLNVNGHDGQGKAADYKQLRCINLAKRGILALNLEWFGMGQLRGPGFAHDRITAIDLTGTSGIAVHTLNMKRALDIALELPAADPARVGVTGLSGGGWQTIFFSGLETRVTLADPVAGYSSFLTRIRHFSDLGDPEQTPSDMATVLDYAHLTAMLAPRPALLSFNQTDNCCFAAPHALPPLAAAAAPVYSMLEKEANLRFHVNVDPGDHNYGADNRQALYRLIGDHWFPGASDFERREIASESELKKPAELDVPLPPDNLDLHALAVKLADALPARPAPPADRAAVASYREERRKRLAELVRPTVGGVKANQVAAEATGGLTVTHWRLRVGALWTVPAVEFAKGDPTAATLVVADGGKKSAGDRALEALARGDRVLAIDPFYFGEAAKLERDNLWPLVVSTVGGRPLGLQAGQAAEIARWLRSERGVKHLVLEAAGPRASVVGRVARALGAPIDALVEHDPLPSLRAVLDRKLTYASAPELFAFGLLREFELDDLKALTDDPLPTP